MCTIQELEIQFAIYDFNNRNLCNLIKNELSYISPTIKKVYIQDTEDLRDIAYRNNEIDRKMRKRKNKKDKEKLKQKMAMHFLEYTIIP